jgi:putative nucleotidyltransferase with HDIG domain
MPTKEEIAARVAEEVDRLPPVPAHIVELRRASADPNVEFSRLVPLLNRDPGLSADLLKFANSAKYGVGHKVDTIEEAVIFFGMANLAEFIAASFAERVVNKTFSSLKGLDLYVEHSRGISAACRVLARLAGLNSHDVEAYGLAGLLHDIGRLVLAIVSQNDSLSLIGSDVERMAQIVESERDLMGVDHCQVGFRICRKWNFPELFEKCILRHHTPVRKDDFSLEGAFVFLAHMVTVPDMPVAGMLRAVPDVHLLKMGLDQHKLAEAGKLICGPPDGKHAG